MQANDQLIDDLGAVAYLRNLLVVLKGETAEDITEQVTIGGSNPPGDRAKLGPRSARMRSL